MTANARTVHDAAGPDGVGGQSWRDAVVLMIPALRAFAWSLSHNSADADDLVQDTLIKAWTHRDKFEVGTNLRAWLFTILRHARAAAARRAARSPILESETLPEAAVSGGQEERQAMRDVATAFRRLATIHREALWLVVVEGLDYAEAARILNVPPGTLRSRLSRAREALRQGIGLEPGEDGSS
jgi:RNA polymerase sigma-70 factor (ECF subfamily)